MTITTMLQWPDPSRLQFRKVDRKWTCDLLLDQRGWFPLPDVMRTLDPKHSGKYRRILTLRDRLLKFGRNPQRLMGIKQFGSRFWAEMPVFSKWYRDNEALQVAKVPKDWDLQEFLSQSQGIFSLRGVLGLLPTSWPIKYPAMKNMIMKSDDPRAELGAARLDGAGYVVFMPRFAEWLQKQVS